MPKISDEKRAARRSQILDAAWSCFQREGLHATTMDDIIRASGLSAGAVYSYFKSKDELIFAALTTSLSGLRERLEPLFRRRPPPLPPELVAEIATIVTGFTAREGYDLKRIALLGWGEAQRNEALRLAMRGFYLAFRGELAAIAAAWRELGIIGGADDDRIAKTLLALSLGYVVEAVIVGDVSPDDIGAGLSGLAPPAAAKG